MQVVRQDADGNCVKLVALSNRRVDLPKAVDVTHQDIARPVGESHGEEKDAALDFHSAILRHDRMTLSSLKRRKVGKGARMAECRRSGLAARLCPPYDYGE